MIILFFRLFRNPNRYVFFALDIICRFVSHSIYMAVVMNYVCYCELVIFYCKSIRLRLEEKSIELAESMKRIVDLGLSLSQLNSATSRMMSISIIIFLARFILGMEVFSSHQFLDLFFCKVKYSSLPIGYLPLRCGSIVRCMPLFGFPSLPFVLDKYVFVSLRK